MRLLSLALMTTPSRSAEGLRRALFLVSNTNSFDSSLSSKLRPRHRTVQGRKIHFKVLSTTFTHDSSPIHFTFTPSQKNAAQSTNYHCSKLFFPKINKLWSQFFLNCLPNLFSFFSIQPTLQQLRILWSWSLVESADYLSIYIMVATAKRLYQFVCVCVCFSKFGTTQP